MPATITYNHTPSTKNGMSPGPSTLTGTRREMLATTLARRIHARAYAIAAHAWIRAKRSRKGRGHGTRLVKRYTRTPSSAAGRSERTAIGRAFSIVPGWCWVEVGPV